MSKLAFRKQNYQLMIIGLVLLVIGFTIMALDKEPMALGFSE